MQVFCFGICRLLSTCEFDAEAPPLLVERSHDPALPVEVATVDKADDANHPADSRIGLQVDWTYHKMPWLTVQLHGKPEAVRIGEATASCM